MGPQASDGKTKDKLATVALWAVCLTVAWSLPVLSLVQQQAERERMESGYYYTPKLAPEHYVVEGDGP